MRATPFLILKRASRYIEKPGDQTNILLRLLTRILTRSSYQCFEQPLTKKALPGKLFPSLALFLEDSQISHLKETRNIIWISNGYTVGFQVQSYWNEFCSYIPLEVIQTVDMKRTMFLILIRIKMYFLIRLTCSHRYLLVRL